MNTLIDRLKAIMKQYKFHYWRILRHPENKDLMEFIDSWSDKLEGHRLSTKIFWVLHDIHDFPLCKECGKPLNRDTDIQLEDDRYHSYCSKKCAYKSTERNTKIKNTNIVRYGGVAPVCSEVVKNKIRKTCLDRYGVEYSTQSEQMKSKTRDTNVKRYGVESPTKLESVQNKIKQTCMERYGTTNGGCSKDALEKIRRTNQSRYGVNSSFELESVREKSRQTNLRKYGVEYYLSSLDHKKQGLEISRKSYNETILKNEYDEPMFSEDEYISIHIDNPYHEFEFRCKKCGNTFKSFHRNGIHQRCPLCFKRSEKFEENELFDLLKSITADEIVHGIGGKKIIPPFELDFYIPTRKIAFEFDGLYWHSEDNGKDKRYHLAKTEMCEQIGIRLIHVFEDEWIYRRDIVSSRVRNILGCYEHTVYARKCHVEEIDQHMSGDFIEKNHIQGNCSDKIRLGLFLDDELVSVMTFGASRFNKKYDWELLRFCNKLNYHVIGGAGKLLKYFERKYNPKNLISYADRRWSVGNLYDKLGFSKVGVSVPSYSYVKNGRRLSRIGFQKHKLNKILEKFDENLSEVENMKNNGYFRIWDCGNLVYAKEYSYES